MLLLAKGLGLHFCNPHNFEPVYVQDTTAQLQSQLVDEKTRLENQEFESRKADSKFKFSLAETEKLKTSFEAERNAWAKEKTALTQQAEKAEATLQEATTELIGLKCHVS